jgi:EAL domain-containing protein (putative c-di-GMP-specific phosphodiesterase class I)/GGDEF domain-containing protein
MRKPDLLDALPDLVLVVKRDGSTLEHAGGRAVPALCAASGDAFSPGWSETTAALVRQLVRKAIADRAPAEARFNEREDDYEIRVTPQGPDRAICVVRPILAASSSAGLEVTGEHRQLQLDRRGFLRRFKETISVAALRERPVAVAVLYIDEIADIAEIIATRVSEQIMSTALARLPAQPSDGSPGWYLGQLGENLLALVVESTDREIVEGCVARVCASLREPIGVADAEFRLTPYAGVSILGVDASSPRVLLDHARAAAAEARRAVSRDVFFFSDTLQLKSLARIDIARELREAIASRAIRLRYTGRHDLRTGRRVAWVGYVRWLHPLRGEIRPAEFLRVAQTTGLATSLSRSVLEHLPQDFAELSAQSDADVRVSLGALRDHVLHEDFTADVEQLLAASDVPAERLELRIAEKVFVARDSADLRSLQKRGVQFVVDEVGRSISSLTSLARAPIWGLQLDRAWVQAVRTDSVARNVCHAGIAMASALGLTAIATGVDDSAQRAGLLELGCRFGMGDLYGGLGSSVSALPPAAERA